MQYRTLNHAWLQGLPHTLWLVWLPECNMGEESAPHAWLHISAAAIVEEFEQFWKVISVIVSKSVLCIGLFGVALRVD